MLNQLGLLLYTKVFGQYVGSDTFNNKYYQSKKQANLKRWVVYNGYYDPSKIPAEWHSWLHFTQDHPPQMASKTWIPNTTGTKFAQKNISSIENIPQTALNCYERWTPDK
jgi:NADH:ubiquinone oxidoreductase subunit